jgi:predicted 2-oxoglutarate/Fe(II)-dependent dioxygenase YbiX
MEEIIVNKDNDQSEFISLIPSGYFGDSPDNIVEISNFLTSEEKEKLKNFAVNNTVWDTTESKQNENGTVTYDADYWADRVATYISLEKVDPTILPLIQNMQQRLKVKVDEFFNINARPTGPAVVKWPVGTLQEPHADKELHEGPDAGKPNAFPYYDIASIFYFNDDYEGGELYFPLQDIKIKPKAGSAYFFPGDMNYVHGVTKVTSGIRFTCPFFWTVVENFNTK